MRPWTCADVRSVVTLLAFLLLVAALIALVAATLFVPPSVAAARMERAVFMR